MKEALIAAIGVYIVLNTIALLGGLCGASNYDIYYKRGCFAEKKVRLTKILPAYYLGCYLMEEVSR